MRTQKAAKPEASVPVTLLPGDVLIFAHAAGWNRLINFFTRSPSSTAERFCSSGRPAFRGRFQAPFTVPQ